MDKKPTPISFDLSLPDVLIYFASDHPAWRLAALALTLVAMVTMVYLVTRK